MAATTATQQQPEIRPFRVHVPEAELVELRRRVNATKWPERETVADASQGVQLATIQALARYWGTDYDWRKVEARLNALPNFVTEIDGLDIHFIHVRSKHENALPLIVTHGWPGSIIEQLGIIDLLANPTARGGSASDAFHLVIPSMPGYGFSGKPTATGWDPARIARAWVVLMQRLGYTRFVAQGGDWGGLIVEVMAQQAPPELLGIHTNFPATVPPDVAKALQSGGPPPSDLTAEERRAYEQLDYAYKHRGYAAEMGTRPQTLYAIEDSPVGLAAWMIDHDTPSYLQIAQGFDGHPVGGLTPDAILDNITLYWVTKTAISSARLYWENKYNFFNAMDISVPTAVSVFPGERYQAPRSWAERAYHKLIYYNKLDKGGHFAAWEQPQLFSEEVRAGFRSLRMKEEAKDKTDDGFDAATFAQHFNQFSPEYGAHFRDIYRHMRGHCPVAHTDELGGYWVVTRYADIMRVDSDDEAFSSLYGVLPSANPNTPRREFGPERTGPLAACPRGPNGEAPHLSVLPLELDPPLHGPYRKVLDPLFSPHAVAELAPWLLALTNQLIDAIIEKGEGDFSRDLSTPLASILTMKFLGLPLKDWSDYAWFIQSAHGGTSSVQPRTKNLSERELRERVAAEVVRQRAQPVAGGAIARLLDTTVDGRKLDGWEIEAYLWLMIGNVDGTQACMGSGFVWLSRHPEQQRRLAETPHLVPQAIEEFLRVFSPRQAFSRAVMQDVELAGQSLKRGDRVLLCWVSGDLDEAEFESPEEVDFDRANKRHMAFGLGSHRCMAPDVVRLEFRILFEQILSRMPDFRVEQTGLRPSPVPAVVAGYEHVPFVFTPGKKAGGPGIADDPQQAAGQVTPQTAGAAS